MKITIDVSSDKDQLSNELTKLNEFVAKWSVNPRRV